MHACILLETSVLPFKSFTPNLELQQQKKLGTTVLILLEQYPNIVCAQM
jgi:hypothetical protein